QYTLSKYKFVGLENSLAAKLVQPVGTDRPARKGVGLVHPHVNKDIGIVDSGCSRSMTGNKDKLDDFNKVLFTDAECLVLTKEFKLPDESQVVLRIPRRHDLYTFNLLDIQPEQHINWLPLKLFTNKHNCVTCNKGKQHKASYKAISALRIVFEPLQLLHMDLFGPTSIRSIDHKYYSLVVTNNFSRFCWAFFMGTKDETFYILKDFIGLIENQLNKKVEETLNLRYLEDKPNVQGLGQEWYFNLDYLTDSLGYQRFKTNPPAGTHDTNILAGIQADDSEFKCDEQVILVPYFPSNSFSAHSVAAKHGFEFSVDSAAMLPQAAIEIRRNLVPAAGAPAGSLVSTGGVPAGSVPASGVPAGSVPASGVPAGSVPASSVPAGRVLAGSIVFAEFGAPADSASVLAVFTTAPTDTSPLPPGYSLGSYKHSTRFPSPSDLGNRQPTTGIFSFSSYDDDFCANVTNLASNVVVDHVATKRVNTFHPQSQIIGALQSPVQTRSTVQKSKFSKSAFISYVHNQNRINHVDHLQCLFAYFFSQLEPSSVAKALEDPDWVAAMQKEMQQFYNQQVKQLPDGIFISQDKYVKDMLKKFDMESVRTATIPYEVPKHKSKDDPDDAVNVYLFRSMIGSLMYLTASRPDIMFAVSACSRHQLEAYSDNDYAGSHGDRKSTTGGWKFLGRRLISWQCKKQIIVATYSTKDEYVAAASTRIGGRNKPKGRLTIVYTVYTNFCAVSCGLLLYFVSNVSRYPKLQVVQVLLLVALVHADDLLLIHADDLVPAGGCIIPTDSYSFMLVTWFLLFLVHPVGLVPTGSYVVPAVYVWFLLILKISNIVWDDHNKVAYLEKGKGWEAYEHILDILNCSHIRYALTHRTTIVFDSLVKQFWATATVHTLEAGPSDIIATIDVNEVVVTKSLISTQLQLNNVNGLYEFTLHDILDGMQAIGYPIDGSLTFYKAKLSPQ
nr:hypothetical protein [Tanacetum cinerariifolium]